MLWLPDLHDPGHRARLADERRLAEPTPEENAVAADWLSGRRNGAGVLVQEFAGTFPGSVSV